MSWASHPTTEMPTDSFAERGKHRARPGVVATVVSASGLAALLAAAMLAPSLVGWPPPADPAAPRQAATLPAATPLIEPAPPASPSTTSAPTVADSLLLESEVYRLTNAERANLGCPALRLDQNLATAARDHSVEMARTAVFGHAANGSDPGERMRRAGYDTGRGWAENIALGQPSAAAVMAAWLGSTEHRANILDCSMQAIGIGAARDDTKQIYWTQDFGGR
ncbi:MAG: CAP domain-containing protein [Sporichthyaceae bacterium]|nr:CAP domain-containing protein [Sporichthyaceae bacterium]